MSQESDVAAPAAGIPAPPSLPSPPPRPANAPPPTAFPAGHARSLSALPTATPATSATKKKGAFRRFVAKTVKLTVVAAILGAIGLVGYRATHKDTIAFPTFAEPAPAYQSITLRIEGYEGTTHQQYTVLTNHDASLIDMRLEEGKLSASLSEVITDGATAFTHLHDGTWVYAPYDNTEGGMTGLQQISHLYMWNDLFTDGVRDHSSIASKEVDQIDGRTLTKYEVLIELVHFRHDDPEAYNAFADYVGADEAIDKGRIVAWVDEHGIIWRLSSYDDGAEATAGSTTMVEYSTNPVTPSYPAEYTDLVNPPGAPAPTS